MNTIHTDRTITDAKRFLMSHGVNLMDIDRDALVAEAIKYGFEPQAHLPTEPKSSAKPRAKPSAKADAISSAINKAIADAVGSIDLETPALDESTIITLIEKHATKTIEVITPTGTTTCISGAHAQFEQVLKLVSIGLKPYLTGVAGTGKTTLAKQVAESLELPFYFTGAVFSKHELFGYMDANGKYVGTPFRDAYETGGVFLFDEIDAGAEDVLPAFNAAIENGLAPFPDGLIKMHKDCKIIAAANTVGSGATLQYNGRSAIDGATLNRYFILNIEIDEVLEERLTLAAYAAAGGGVKSEATDWLRLVRTVRIRAEQSGICVIASPRDAYQGAAAIAYGFTIKDAVFGTFGSSLTESQLIELGVD